MLVYKIMPMLVKVFNNVMSIIYASVSSAVSL